MIRKLWVRTWSQLFQELSSHELRWLVTAEQHVSLLASRRAHMVLSRVRIVSALFALLTPLWIAVDLLTLPREIAAGLAVLRLAATAGFVAIVVGFARATRLAHAYWALTCVIGMPMAFYLATVLFLSQFDVSGLPAALLTGYGFLPFVMVAALAIFPLTAVESALGVLTIVAVVLAGGILRWSKFSAIDFYAEIWLLALIGAVTGFAGLSQLAYTIALVREAIRDALTGSFSRASGAELLEVQFTLSIRSDSPLCVAFVDLDCFKEVNDRHGHAAGDAVLREAAERMRSTLRNGDMLVRWGGEEFLIIMPNTLLEHALAAVERVRAHGLGQRPDGAILTASIGIAERKRDGASSWLALVHNADQRMYVAKSSGRDRLVWTD